MLRVWTKHFPAFSFCFLLPCKTTLCSCSVVFHREFVQFCVTQDIVVWPSPQCSYTQNSIQPLRQQWLTPNLRRPMQHDIDFWAAETIRLCGSCYTGVFWRFTAHVCPCLHHLKPHLHKQNLQCFSIPLEALWLTLQEPVIDFCQCTRNRYLGKVHIPGRGTEPGFHCVKCSLWFFSCEIELFCMIQGLAWWP